MSKLIFVLSVSNAGTQRQNYTTSCLSETIVFIGLLNPILISDLNWKPARGAFFYTKKTLYANEKKCAQMYPNVTTNHPSEVSRPA